MLLEQLLNVAPVDEQRVLDRESMQTWAEELGEALRCATSNGAVYDITLQKHETGYAVDVSRSVHGNAYHQLLTPEFFQSPEYAALAKLSESLQLLLGPGALLSRGDKEFPVTRLDEAMSWLMREARKGQTLQRYKGRGEMNPDQLWDTTMNPETRRLLQVNIEDAVAADQIFSTLWGEQVESRREFIEQNALSASNIDI